MVELSQDVAQEKGDKARAIRGYLHVWTRGLLLFLGISGLLFAIRLQNILRLEMYNEQYLGLALGVSLAIIFLTQPIRSKGPWNRVPWYDFLAHVLALACGVYTFWRIRGLATAVQYSSTDVLVAIIVTVISIEAIRRLLGGILLGLALGALAYGFFGSHLPGLAKAVPMKWSYTVAYLYYDESGTLGLTLLVIFSIVVAFFMLSEILMILGGHQFLVDFAAGVLGHFRGGPAKVAVVSSSLFGMISGSAVANVVFCGTFTIPMMKKAGYPPHVAGAIEGAASTGGQLMPPMMGVAAFLMASFLGITYAEVCLGAIIPSFLYYLALLIQTDTEAFRYQIRGLPSAEYPPLRKTMRKALLFVIPLVLLVYFLFFEWLEADIAAGYTAIIVMFIGFFLTWKDKAMIKGIQKAFENAAKQLLSLALIGIIAGIVMGALAQTGLATTLGHLVVEVGDKAGSLVMLTLVAIVSIILGMGMPTPIVYIFLASLVGTGLVQAGLDRFAAHMFIQYFGLAAMVTPPVCVAAYAGAQIAGADYWKTGWTASRFGVSAYIVPYLFVYQPAIMGRGASAIEVIVYASASVVIIYSIIILMSGYTFATRLNWPLRSLAAILACVLSYAVLCDKFQLALLFEIVSIPILIVMSTPKLKLLPFLNRNSA